MASEIGLRLVVGASLAASFQSVLGGAKKNVVDRGAMAQRLQVRHERLGAVMARAMDARDERNRCGDAVGSCAAPPCVSGD